MKVTMSLALMLAPALGPEAERAGPAPDLGRLLTCRGLHEAADRLACFDREAQALGARLGRGELVVIDEEKVREAQRRRFGLAPPGLEMFTGASGQRLSTVRSTVKNAVPDTYGKWIVTLADDSRWHQIDDASLARTPDAGQAAVINRGAVGSFRMTIANQTIRVHRER